MMATNYMSPGQLVNRKCCGNKEYFLKKPSAFIYYERMLIQMLADFE